MNPTPPVVELTEERVGAAIAELQAACERDLKLAPHLKIAIGALTSYLKIAKIISRRGTSMQFLRRLLGIEVHEDGDPKHDAKTKERPGSRRGSVRHEHGRRGSKDFPNADHRFFTHPDFDEPGTLCPGCERGHLYPSLGAWHRFHGQPLLRVTIVHHEIWRCTLCAQSFPAPIAQDIIADGKPGRP